MALQFIDGFDHYYLTNDVGFTGGSKATGQKWDSSLMAGEMYPKIASGRFGSGMALKIEATGGQGWIQKLVTTQRDEMIVGFAFLPNVSRADTTRVHFRYDDGGDTIMTINMSTGIISALSSGGGSVVSAAATVDTGAWQYIEFKLKIHSTLGELEIRVGGIDVASTSAVNTGATGALIQSLRLESNNNAQLDLLDDLYLLDTTGTSNNDFLGDVRVDVLYPNADGTNNDFTLFDDGTQSYSPIVNNFDAVRNEGNITIGRDHNYVESGLIGASEDYDNHSLADISVTPSTIFGVQVVNNTKKTDTGTLRFKDEMIIAGTAYDNGTEVTATSSDYSMSTYIRDTDPSDGLPWTSSKVAATGSGFSITFREA